MKKRITFVFLAMLLVFPYPDRDVGSTQSTVEANSVGEVASKDEVVYGTLSATGDLNEIYVVNMLDVTKSGVVIDHGEYTAVTNLTNLLDMEQVDDTVQFQASTGWFFYQGNMEASELPWDVNISYMLDGNEISPEDLPGKEGHLNITIKTSKNENVDPLFYENYMMQISLTLDTDIISNIQAPDATMVNVGKKRQLNYTLMPEAEGEISLLADVVNFEMEGIDLFAIPMSMAFDDFEIDTSEMRSLSDAIGELNSGVSKLKTGVSELNDGVQGLNTGSSEYHSGMIELKNSSSQIINASETIEEALTVISRELSGSQEEIDLSGLAKLPEGLTLIAGGLGEVANGLTLLNENFTMAYAALSNSIERIPAPAITEEEIQQLYASGANHKTIDYLLEVYAAAQTAKGTYNQVKEAFTAVETALAGASGVVSDLSNQLTYIARELSGAFEGLEGLDALNELQEGIALLAGNYTEFHSGLVSYTDGVSMLADAYKEINSGFNKVAEGSSELESGVGELQAGTKELADATKDLPDKMQEEIDAIMDEFDKSDFEAISFVSPKNTNVNLVQFILKTEAIELVDETTITEEEEEKPGFWQRLWELFF